MSVPNAPLREAFLRSGLTAHEVCVGADLYVKRASRPKRTADTTHLERTLGLKATYGRAGATPTYRTTAPDELALRIGDALCLDPHEIGL
ncbi:MAG: hypothetical protein M3R46_06275 [Actinomycetota bacterium]|nr:hypothetical protein [Actinomycetota bacterium]